MNSNSYISLGVNVCCVCGDGVWGGQNLGGWDESCFARTRNQHITSIHISNEMTKDQFIGGERMTVLGDELESKRPEGIEMEAAISWGDYIGNWEVIPNYISC